MEVCQPVSVHVNTQKNHVLTLLGAHAVATEAQLRRLGVWRGAELLGLPMVTRSMVTHGHKSLQDLTFVARDQTLLEGSVGMLGHRAGLFELTTRRPLPSPMQWSEVASVRSANARRHQRPDAVILDLTRPVPQMVVAAVEIDVGYPRTVLRRKLLGAISTGHTAYVLGTTIHSRVAWFRDLVAEAAAGPQGVGLAWAEVRFLDFWSSTDPYRPRPRCHKVNSGVWVRPGMEQCRPAE